MPRTKGAKDKKRRRMNPNSLANLMPLEETPQRGALMTQLRLYLTPEAAKRVGRLSPARRGMLLEWALDNYSD